MSDVVAGNLVINLIAQTAKFQSTMKSMTGSLKDNEAAFKTLSSSVKIAGAAIAAFGAAALYAVKQAADEELVFRKLRTQIELNGIAWGGAKKNIDSFISSLQATTRYGDTDTAAVLQSLMIYTNDLSKAMRGAKLSMDIASSGLFDVNTASRYVGMAMSGNIEILGRYLPEFKAANNAALESMSANEKAAYAIEVLTKKFGGAAEKEMVTFNASWAQFKNYLGDIVESIGNFLLPAMTAITQSMITWIQLNQDLLRLDLSMWIYNISDSLDIMYLKIMKVVSAWAMMPFNKIQEHLIKLGYGGATLPSGETVGESYAKHRFPTPEEIDARIKEIEAGIGRRTEAEYGRTGGVSGTGNVNLGVTRTGARKGTGGFGGGLGIPALTQSWEQTMLGIDMAIQNFYSLQQSDAGGFTKIKKYAAIVAKDVGKTFIYELENVSYWFTKDVLKGGWKNAFKELKYLAEDAGANIAAGLIARLTTDIFKELGEWLYKEVLKNLVKAFLASEVVQGVWDWVSGVGTGIYDSIKNSLVKSADWTKWFTLGFKSAGTWVYNSIKDNLNLKDLYDKVMWFVTLFKDAGSWLGKSILDILDSDPIKNAASIAGSAWAAAGKLAASGWSALTDVLLPLAGAGGILWVIYEFAKSTLEVFGLIKKDMIWISDHGPTREEETLPREFPGGRPSGGLWDVAPSVLYGMTNAELFTMLGNYFKWSEQEYDKWVNMWRESSYTRAADFFRTKGFEGFKEGGIVHGISGKPVPILAHAGEEVLTSNDPRHRNNNGGMVTVNINNPTVIGQRGANELADIVVQSITRRAKLQMRYST